MKKILVTIVLIGATVFSFGQSVAVPDHALSDLKSVQLERENLAIYEEQAVLKLQDVLDYIEIISSSQYNLELRKAAMEAALSNFDANASLSCNWLSNATSIEPQKCVPQRLLSDLLKQAPYELKVGSRKVKIQQKLHPLSRETYQGELAYYQQIQIKKKGATQFKKEKEVLVRIKFLLKRVTKQFGRTNETVWEVKFLEIS